MKYCNFTNNRALGTDIDRDLFDLTKLSQIKAVGSESEVVSQDYLYVVVENNGTHNVSYTMYVYKNGAPVKLEYTTETGPSPTDWATDEYFGGDGGTIFWRGDHGTVDNCRFIDSNSARRGGGAYMTGSDNITFQNSYFENCTSGTNGGGLDWLAGANYGKVINCTFNNTRAARSAGAIYYDGDYGEMRDVYIINTRSYGGTLTSTVPGLTYADWDASHWDTNTTGGDAGAIMFTGDHEYIYNVTFINATAQGRGGAVFLQDNKNITFEACKFIGCEALGIANNTWNDFKNEYDGSGYNYKLTGHGGAIAFDIGAHDAVIKDSEFTYNYARRDGGAINIADDAYNATIENCIFSHNSAGDDGGAINWAGDLGLVKNVTCYNNTGVAYADPVTGNSSSIGGTMCIEGHNVTVTQSSFTLSQVLYNNGELNKTNAGAIAISGNNATVSDCTFDTCFAPNNAGAISIIGNYTTFINCTFTNCYSAEDGAAIYVDGLYCELHNSTFTNNTVGNDGGAIYWKGSYGTIYNATFDNCTAPNNAGAVSIIGNHTIFTNSAFKNCYAAEDGAAIYVDGYYCELHNSTFTDNIAGDDGGAIYWKGSYGTIYNITCYNNKGISRDDSHSNGGSLAITGDYISVDRSSFKVSSAGIVGGAIYLTGSYVNITNSEFEDCNVSHDIDYVANKTYVPGGGAIYVIGDSVNIVDSNFTNTNGREGGAIYIQGNNVTVDGAIINSTYASVDGGAIVIEGNNSVISDTDIENSKAITSSGYTSDNLGGAIYIVGTDAKIGGTIVDAHAYDGGAIYIKQGGNNVNISNVNISDCSVTDKGGAIYIDGNNAVISDSYIENVEAKAGSKYTSDNLGGAIYIHGTDAKIGATIVDAHAYDGGAIYIVQGGNNVNISHANISDCSVTDKGGAIYIDGNNAVISDSYIENVEAKAGSSYTSANLGGAIYIQGINAKIGATIVDAHAYDGGAIYIKQGGNNANISNSNISGCSATNSGGAIYIYGDYTSIIDSVISNNYAKASKYTTNNLGGAVYIYGNNANITGSKFEGNNATKGGSIYSRGSFATVYNSNFTDNRAYYDGGAIYWEGETNSQYNTVDSCVFTANIAYAMQDSKKSTIGGGAIFWSQKGTHGSVLNSEFYNNSVQTNGKADGGAILWDQSLHGVIDNCIFDGNYIQTTKEITDNLYAQGGALFLRITNNYTVSNCIFKNSWSQMEGGAVYLSTRAPNGYARNTIGSKFINLTFINNTAKNEGEAPTANAGNNFGGGAAFIKECNNFYFENITVINNTASTGGGFAIVPESGSNNLGKDCVFNNLTFRGNEATLDGAGIWAWNVEIKLLANIKFINNTAGRNGGGLYSKVYFAYENLTFINNTAANGGALYWNYWEDSRNMPIQNINFINNRAINNGTTDSGRGGAIYLPLVSGKAPKFKVLSNNFTGNTAVYGGAIYVDVSPVVISDNTFTRNSAVYGGAIYEPFKANTDYAISITDSYFNENEADYGGAINLAVSGSTINKLIEYCNFTRNVANVDGGAVYVNGSYQQITNCTFDGNNATGNGGSVYVAEDLLLTNILYSTFMNSNAANGGAIYKNDSATTSLKINYDKFINNTAVYNGGAVLYIAKGHKYRDYNKFDGIAETDSANKTNVTSVGDNPARFITDSIFDWDSNNDYSFVITPIADIETPTITVYLSSPDNEDYSSTYFVINASDLNSTTVLKFTEFHYNSQLEVLYMVLDQGILINGNYTLSAGFSDGNHMYKEIKINASAKGLQIGEFELLQQLIENNISAQKASNPDAPYYIVNLTRVGGFTFTNDTLNNIYDKKCINLTNIDKPIIIYGNGWRIDALGYSRIFNITACNVTIVGVELANGDAGGYYGDKVDMGGAIFWAGAYGQIIKSIIDNCTAERGGGIYYNASAVNCTIINTVFTHNNATTFGGAIDCNASRMGLFNTTFEENFADTGAALCREINATNGYGLNNTFRKNVALTNGSALAWINAKRISIDTYYFYENHVGNSGGAIYVGQGSENCEIKNCVFEDNYVDNDTDGHGGAIEWYAKEGLVFNSNFTRNYAYHGGAIYVGFGSDKINITESTFTENRAHLEGGAISIEASSVIVRGSDFNYNNATYGGALYVGGEGNINYVYSSNFVGNEARDGVGGAIDWVASSGTIVDSNLTANCANYGGGIYFGGNAAESTITNCNFASNHAKYNGGAIDCNSSAMYLTNTTFDDNWAQYGAALCREVNAKGGHGANNTFTNNHAYISGAALGWMGSVNITIINYTFINNSADVTGGAVYVAPDSHNCSIIDCYFENNYVTNVTNGGIEEFKWTAWDGTPMKFEIVLTDDSNLINKTIVYDTVTSYYYAYGDDYTEALGFGGAVAILASNATIINTEFVENAARLGGAIYVGADSGNTIVNRSKFTSNHALERGGAINLHASAVHIDNGEFKYNTAIDGAALYAGGVGTNNVVHTTLFEGNDAANRGGGIYWRAAAGEIKGSEFTDNHATNGGGIYLNGVSENTNITNTIFRFNNATENGGAIDCNAENIGIYNLTFEDNYAGRYGAALCREVNATHGHGDHNNFTRNHAGIAGAALAWMGVDDIHIDYYNFINNTAGQSGGAIYVSEGSDNCIIDHCYFNGNYIINDTGGHGGAVDIVGDDATIINSEFLNNGAFYGGAIFAGNSSGNTNITNVTFDSNYASIDGGAIQIRGSSVLLNDTRFYSNTAERSGGAIYVGGTGDSNKIYYSVFDDNKAGDHGGAIDWVAKSGDIFYSNFTNNEAIYGGAIYLNGYSSYSRIFNDIFINNTASKNGGAIDCNASNMGLNNTQFINNYAGEYGAALCREANATHGFGTNNTFIGNQAGLSGAALAWLGVTGIHIDNYTFINNTAFKSGGAIFVRADSPDCEVVNCKFDNNYVTDIRQSHGGAIDWHGPNGYIFNTIFDNSFALNGGSVYVDSENMIIIGSLFDSSRALANGGAIDLHSDNVTITNSTFIYCVALRTGGAIAGHGAYNATIDGCIFNHTIGAGDVDSSSTKYGEGGAIYWDNANNLMISNTKFLEVETHYNGALSAINCNDSALRNVTFSGIVALGSGGSISWINSTNITIDGALFENTAASYAGGSICFDNIDDAVVKNARFNNTSTPWGNGGAIYVNGNVDIENATFEAFSASSDNGAAIYFHNGTSSVSDSCFNGTNAIWAYHYANVTLTRNNITGEHQNKDVHYLTEPYDAKTNQVFYSVWNDGDLYLKGNNFDYIIFNNGTIWTKTTTVVIKNDTWNETWNESFDFFAEITDDNNNTIISVETLDTWNDVYINDPHYPMPYNYLHIQSMFYQGVFHILANDSGLKNNTIKYGTIKVKMPTTLTINFTNNQQEEIPFSVKLTLPTGSNGTFDGNKLKIKINGEAIETLRYTRNLTSIILGGEHWYEVYVNFTEFHMPVGTYTITAEYEGDDLHWNASASEDFTLFLREMWIAVHADDIFYGQTLIVNVNSSAFNTVNGRITIRIDGREVSGELHLHENGTYVYYLPNDNYTAYVEPGNHIISVTFEKGTYYAVHSNSSNFTVYSLSATMNVTPTNITYGENEIINVTIDQNAHGYIAVRIGEHIYTSVIDSGFAQFNITGLNVGDYNATVTYFTTDNHYAGNSTNITFNVAPTGNYNMSVKADNVTYGQNVTIKVLLPTYHEGNVTIFIDGKLNRTVEFGHDHVAVWKDIPLEAGLHNITAHFNGCMHYLPKDVNTTVFVGPAEWTPGLHINETVYLDNATFEITVPEDLNSTYVNLTVENVTYVVNITNGRGNMTFNNITAGMHEATVSFAGNARYANASYTTHYHITKLTPNINLTRTDNNVIVATVDGNSTGNVTFVVNGIAYHINLVNGNATLTGKLNIGLNNVVAIYNPDDNHNTVGTMANYTIDKLDALVNVTVNDTVYGNPVEITVQVGVNQTGYVTITVNNEEYSAKLNSQGKATFTIKDLEVGNYTVNVAYDGNSIYMNGTNSTSFNVTKADMSAVVTPKNVTVDEHPSFVIDNLSPRDFEGNVRITINGTEYYDGPIKSVIEIEKIIKADNYSANVTFYGNKNYNNNSYIVNFTVSRIAPEINATIENVVYPANATALVNVSSKANGTIEIYNGTRLVGTGSIANGTASINLTSLAAGVYEVTVRFITDDDYNANATTTATFVVSPGATTVEIIRNGTDVIAVVTPGVTGNVTFYINGEEFTNVTVNGNATIKGKLHIGNNTVSVIYRGNENYTGCDNATVLEIIKITTDMTVEATPKVVVGKNTTITVTMVNVTSGKVLIEVNGYNYTVDINNNGEAVLVVALPVGKYNATAYYLGDIEHEACTNSSAEFEVLNKTAPKLNVTVDDLTVEIDHNITFTVNTTSNATDLVVKVNGEVATKVGDGRYAYNATVAGNYTITVEIGENDYYFAAQNASDVIVVYKHASGITSVIADPNTTVVGKNTTITVTMAHAEKGTVLIEVNGYNYTVEINGNTAVLTVALPVGKYNATAYYLGDDKYNTTEGKTAVEFNVTGKQNATVIINAAKVVVVDGQLIFNVTNSTPVVVTINGVKYDAVNGNYTFDATKVGNYTIVARTVETDMYYAGFNSTVFAVIKANSTITVNASSTTVDGEVEINVTGPSDIDGIANIRVNNVNYTVTIVNGNGSIKISGIGYGTHEVNVTYIENDKYLSSTNKTEFSIQDKYNC
jgi:predicted outer membrane repeat protein